MNLHIRLFVQITIVILIAAESEAQKNPYEDVASQMGIEHTYIINNSGGGVSFVDFNMDGNDDITLATGRNEAIQFYLNNGNSFELIDLGIHNLEQSKSVLWVDIDNDGDKDFYASAFDGANRLYENKGDMVFEQITEAAGLPIDSLKSFGAIWGDYNRDGFLDLYYTERPNNNSGTLQRNRLFKNLGNNTFEEVTYETNAADEGRLPFCAAFFDYNHDKWPDIYIANDRKKRNTLLQNVGGTFVDVTDTSNAGIEIDAMNVGIADVDNNGQYDIYITNTPSGSALLKCEFDEETGQVTYSDQAGERGVGFYGVGWGANFLDVDNDGWQDLYVSGMLIGSDVISSALYINDQSGYFNPASTGFVGDTVTSYVNAVGDFDNDGYPDIMVNNSEYFNSQLWTAQAGQNNWIKIDLQGIKSNRDGIGSKIEVYTNGIRQIKFTNCGTAFMGQNSNTQLFGIGPALQVDSIKIIWPTGHIDLLKEIAANQKIMVQEGSTTADIISVDSDIVLLTSTEVYQSNPSLQVSPNPAVKIITIESTLPIREIAIYNVSGKYEFTSLQNEVDLTLLPSGLYLARVMFSNGQTQTVKFYKI